MGTIAKNKSKSKKKRAILIKKQAKKKAKRGPISPAKKRAKAKIPPKKRPAKKKTAKRPLSKKEIQHLYNKMDVILGQNNKATRTEVKEETREVERKLARVQAEEKKIEREEGTLLAAERRIEGEEFLIEKKADLIAREEANIERLELNSKAELDRVEDLEKREIQLTEHELAKLKELEHLEQEIKKDVSPHPLMKITIKDFTRGLIGAFIALISHFAFVEGSHISEGLSMQRATALYVIAFLIGFLFIYYSGFRKVKDLAYLKIFPVRIFVIYLTAIIVIFLVLALYGFIGSHSTFSEIYKQVASVSIIAVIGAGTADLLGRE